MDLTPVCPYASPQAYRRLALSLIFYIHLSPSCPVNLSLQFFGPDTMTQHTLHFLMVSPSCNDSKIFVLITVYFDQT